MTYYTREEAAKSAATLSPWAARILIFLFLQERGVSYTGKELAAQFGTSEQTISAAVNNLEANGFIQNNGKHHGWSLLPEFFQMALPSNAAEREKIQKFLKQPEDNSKIFESTSPLIVVDDLTLDSEREDQHQSTTKRGDSSRIFELSPDHRPQGNAGSEQSATILRRIGIRGRAFRRYTTPPCPETAVILAWWFESLMQNLSNPPGWIICRLRDEDAPGDDFLELARFWLALDDDGRDDFAAIFTSGRPAIYHADDLASDFDLSQAAAKLAVELWPLGAFEEQP